MISEDLAFPWDEGIKKFAWSVGTALRAAHEVKLINVDRNQVGPTEGITRVPSTRTFMGSGMRREIAEFAPDVVLYVPSPSSTLASFLRAYWLRRHAPAAVHGMVALMPRRHGALLRPLIAAAAPDVVFAPSYRSLLYLADLDVPAELVAVGVDLETFRPPVAGERESLRRRYGVGGSSYVYLHVGHLSPNRNLPSLTRLAQADGAEVIVVASTSTPGNPSLQRELESGGVRVIREVVAVEELYRLSDCYAFPVFDSEGCVEIPLSVLEALASGLPVLSRPFGGLRDHLPAGEDLRYCRDDAELAANAKALRGDGNVRVRRMAAFSWRNVANGIVASLERRTEP